MERGGRKQGRGNLHAPNIIPLPKQPSQIRRLELSTARNLEPLNWTITRIPLYNESETIARDIRILDTQSREVAKLLEIDRVQIVHSGLAPFQAERAERVHRVCSGRERTIQWDVEGNPWAIVEI